MSATVVASTYVPYIPAVANFSGDSGQVSEALGYGVTALYIVAFSLFIYGLMGLTGPKTAVRGNWIAAVGMGIAIVATLLGVYNNAGDAGVPGINWILIVVGWWSVWCWAFRRRSRPR